MPEMQAGAHVGDGHEDRLHKSKEMRLVWYQRADGLWNTECACSAAIVGVTYEQRAKSETWHFALACMDRAFRTENPEHFKSSQIPACGPKLPECNPNRFDPFVFP